MAKSTTGKRDPQDPQTSERRRRSTSAAQNGADEAAAPEARPRRRAASRRAPGDETTIAAQGAPEAPIALVVESVAVIDVPHEHIAVRAYHIYLERGGRAGDDLEDWITAERELRERVAGQRAR